MQISRAGGFSWLIRTLLEESWQETSGPFQGVCKVSQGGLKPWCRFGGDMGRLTAVERLGCPGSGDSGKAGSVRCRWQHHWWPQGTVTNAVLKLLWWQELGIGSVQRLVTL